MLSIRASDKGRLALFAIHSLATATALAIWASDDTDLVIVIGFPAAVFVAAAVLNHFDLDWIPRLAQLLIGFGLLFVSQMSTLPRTDKVALDLCALIAMIIPGMTWPPRSNAIHEARGDHAPN